ncbi:MAG: hypothetical protein GTN49_03190 [candidate division Zixibacteria bacterium]|nr:hypothetical protein [candidate division Zixibacteria bacterium]
MTKAAKIWLIVGVAATVLLCCCLVFVVGRVLLGKVIKINVDDVMSQPESANVTVANYNRVQIGMTYPQVAAIFGGPGVLAVEAEIAGKRFEVYQWKGLGGGYAQISFDNGKVYDKRQSGLR